MNQGLTPEQEAAAQFFEAGRQKGVPLPDADTVLQLGEIVTAALRASSTGAQAENTDEKELPGQWSHSDFEGGDPDTRSHAERLALPKPEARPEGDGLRTALEGLVAVVGLTAFKYEGQRAVLQEAVDAALAALSSPGAGAWRPMETAPTEKQIEALLLHRFGAIHDALINPNGTVSATWPKDQYTHWMPSPLPPQPPTTGEAG